MGFISGLRNCHLKDLNSYVIRERISDQDGMLRVFHNYGDSLRTRFRDGEFSLAPHNHRQDITLYALLGNPVNVSFAIEKRTGRRDRFEFVFGSKILNGKFELESADTAMVEVSQAQAIPKDGLIIPASEVHTVIAAPNSAWLVVEGRLAPAKQRSLCYSLQHDFRLSADGLYGVMTPEELWLCDTIYRRAHNKLNDLGMHAAGEI